MTYPAILGWIVMTAGTVAVVAITLAVVLAVIEDLRGAR